ncbi:MAG: T2 family ribonuclease [Alphaproteobacteria bacterium]|nr:T2 family ribonuclease [Alphaproteobacteria bacterium]
MKVPRIVSLYQQRCAMGSLRSVHGFFLCLAFIFMAPVAFASDASQCSRFSSYTLSMEWPQTFCRKETNRADCVVPEAVTGWTVHGLWPTDGETNEDITRCEGPAYSESAVSNLVQERSIYWPDLLSWRGESNSQRDDDENSDGFWIHEWAKHGVCALACDPNVTSEADYFSLAMNIVKELDVSQVLSDAGIEPSDTVSVSTQKIVSTLQNAVGAKPAIACYTDDDSGSTYLSEIRFCVDPSTSKVSGCRREMDATHRSCPSEVIYPKTSD